jgi:hypothetical protein
MLVERLTKDNIVEAISIIFNLYDKDGNKKKRL